MPKYDLAVVGAGIAGLSAAALMAKAGKRVILTEPTAAVGGCLGTAERDAFRFSGGPDLTYGLETGGALESLFTTLGIAPSGFSHTVTYQVALPDRRITVAPDSRITLEELRREFPAEIDKFVKLYRQASAIALKCSKSRIVSRLIRWRSAKTLFRSCLFSPEATAYFDVQSRFFFGRSVLDLSLASLVLLLDAAPYALPGGFGLLAEQLQSFIVEHNGHLFLNEPWPEMRFHGRRVSGIKTMRENSEVRSVVLNTSQDPRRRTVFLGIHDNVLPIGMERAVLCVPDYARPADFFSLSFSKAGEDAPKGMRSGTALFHGIGSHDAPFNAFRDRIEKLIPFLTQYLVSFNEQEQDTRRFALPDNILRKRRGSEKGPSLLTSTTVRNLFLLDDSPHAVQQSVRSAQFLVSRLG